MIIKLEDIVSRGMTRVTLLAGKKKLYQVLVPAVEIQDLRSKPKQQSSRPRRSREHPEGGYDDGWKAMADYCDTIIEEIDDLPDRAWDKASDFLEDVKRKVIDVQETMTQNEDYTAAQQQALENWRAGIKKWQR